MRKTVIALAAVAALTAGSTMAALAHGHGGGGGGGHGGGFGGHMGGGHWGGGFGHAAFVHSGGFRGARAFHFQGNHVAFGRHHHRFFRSAFIGTGYSYYPYDDSCRVWTPWGWRWVCDY
jgi:hypothetical protein